MARKTGDKAAGVLNVSERTIKPQRLANVNADTLGVYQRKLRDAGTKRRGVSDPISEFGSVNTLEGHDHEQSGMVDAMPDRMILSRSGVVIGTPEQVQWLLGLVKAIFVLNLLDAVFTLIWVHAGLAEEANALMRDLVNNHAVRFVLAKLALVSLGSILLWYRRHHPLAVIAIFFTFLAYYLIFLYHLQFSSKLLL